VRTLPVGNQEALWSDLRQIHQLIACGAPITPKSGCRPASVWRFRSGPLGRLEGQESSAPPPAGASSSRSIFIQQGASVLLEDYCLTMAD